jgi:twinkle protein
MPVLIDDDIDFDYYMRETDAAERVKSSSEYLNAVMYQLAPAHETPKHQMLPFIGTNVQFAPGEVTIWAGFNGSGKSMLQGQVMAGFAEQGSVCCIASMEMKPAKTLARIARQVLGLRHPSKQSVSDFFQKVSQTLWLYDQQGAVKPDRMIAVIRYCAEKLNCQHFAIDSLMKCIAGTDNYNGQKDFVDALTVAARDYNIHIHLVAHLKKGEGDERLPTRLDISGTGAISDLVDNVLIQWRNKKKERDRDAGKAIDESDPDAVLVCDKQRNGEWEGRVKLYFNPESQRFSDMARRKGIANAL